jgi:hypothetical protein
LANQYHRLARALEHRMAKHAAGAVQGLAGELGTIVNVFKSDPYTVKRVWVKLDNFKDVIKDPMFSQWTAKIVIPDFARVVKLCCPVDENGCDVAGTTCGERTRFDFDVNGVVGSEGATKPMTTVEVEVRAKDGLKVGDRVLVVPINNGQDHLIVSKVVSSDGDGCGGCGGCSGSTGNG